MSAEKEKRDMEFRKWKKEIERRCADHLKKNPEHRKVDFEQKALPPPPANTAPLFKTRDLVHVFESVTKPGVWYVYKNWAKVMSFFGENAHQNATKYAGDLLNG